MRALISILFVFAAGANADQLLVNLDSSTLNGSGGSTLAFTGTLTNTTSNILFINSDSFTFQISGALDDTPFLTNAPISLAAMAMSADFAMFDVNVPLLQKPGLYSGVFTVLGGTDASQLNNLGSASFSVNVPTPEPASYLLLGLGIAALLALGKIRPKPLITGKPVQ